MPNFNVSPEEVEELLDQLDTQRPSKYAGMTYEQGIYEALMWVLDGDPELKPSI